MCGLQFWERLGHVCIHRLECHQEIIRVSNISAFGPQFSCWKTLTFVRHSKLYLTWFYHLDSLWRSICDCMRICCKNMAFKLCFRSLLLEKKHYFQPPSWKTRLMLKNKAGVPLISPWGWLKQGNSIQNHMLKYSKIMLSPSQHLNRKWFSPSQRIVSIPTLVSTSGLY